MSWDCPNEIKGICKRVDGAYCQPGMKGCILSGKVVFPGGKQPSPVWPADHEGSQSRTSTIREASDPTSPDSK